MSVNRGALSRRKLIFFVDFILCLGLAAGVAAGQFKIPKIGSVPKSSQKRSDTSKLAKPREEKGEDRNNSSAAPSQTGARDIDEGATAIRVKKDYPWDCALQSEFSINEKTINIYTADTMEAIGEYLKQGWNTITIKTTPQEPATRNNELIFQIGPVRKDPKKDKLVMSPVLWEFKNGTDWHFKDGKFSHSLGPDVKEVTLSYKVYFTDYALENTELKAGDFVLISKGAYGAAWNSPVTATVFVNGTPLNTFLIASREIVVTSLLKQGKNEIKLISTRVKNAIRDNDIEMEVAGPAEWNVTKSRYEVGPVTQFKAMQGWSRNPKTGELMNRASPDSETVERVIPFFLKEAPKPQSQ